MSIQVFGMAVSRGVAIGRAVLVASSRVDVGLSSGAVFETSNGTSTVLRVPST